MLTIDQVIMIERHRCNIEALQNNLSSQAQYSEFYVAVAGTKQPVHHEANEVLRQTLCKFTVAKIVRLLDECEHLGADVSAGKQKLADFLKTLTEVK